MTDGRELYCSKKIKAFQLQQAKEMYLYEMRKSRIQSDQPLIFLGLEILVTLGEKRGFRTSGADDQM